MTYSPKAFQIATLGTSQIGKFVSADDAGDIIIPNDDKLEFGTASDAAILWDTTGTNHLAIATASSAPITIGNATSEVTIGDNLTVTGDLTVNGTTTSWTGVESMPTYTQTVPGAPTNFTQSYSGPGLSNYTLIERSIEIESITDSTSTFTQ